MKKQSKYLTKRSQENTADTFMQTMQNRLSGTGTISDWRENSCLNSQHLSESRVSYILTEGQNWLAEQHCRVFDSQRADENGFFKCVCEGWEVENFEMHKSEEKELEIQFERKKGFIRKYFKCYFKFFRMHLYFFEIKGAHLQSSLTVYYYHHVLNWPSQTENILGYMWSSTKMSLTPPE